MSRILEKLADQHEERLLNVLYNLENDVVKEVTRATKGQLVSQRLAIQLQPKIRQAIEENFLNEADILINEEYNKIAKEVLDNFGELKIPKKFKSLTEIDLQTINALKFQTFSGFEDIAERFLKVINDEVYQSAIAGRPFEDMVSNIRSHINGVYKQSNVTEINELVDFVNENKFDVSKKAQVDEAIRKLHTQYASDRAGNNLRRYAGQIAHDSVMQFHGQFTVAKAKEAGIDKFTYTGTLVRDSREFCQRMLNRVLTEEQIREIWNTQGWAGKSTGDPFIVRGGYRCRHTWIPTVDEIEDEIPEQPEEEQETINVSSLTNKIKLDDIKPVSESFIINKLNKRFKENAKDGRYQEDTSGKPPLRFYDTLERRRNNEPNFVAVFKDSSGRKQDFKWSEKDYGVVEALMQELDELAIKYDVPKLRGINVEKSAIASMGDGVLQLNVRHNILERTGTQVTKWKKGDNIADRPFTADSFFEDKLDKIRTNFYHEFGHHIHQQKFLEDARDYFVPPVELDLKKLRNFRGGSATRYADQNKYEWFAENFSLYELGKTELVDPKFLKFLNEKVL
jgi:uncharacterized protein with gpF-like domain